MSRVLVACVCALLAIASLVGTASAADPAAAEKKARSGVAKLLVEHAAWCAAQGYRTEGARALGEAKELDPSAKGLGDAETAVAELDEDAEEPDAAALDKRRKTAAPKIAKAYEKLAKVGKDAKDAARFDDYLFRGFAWDPATARRKKIVSRIRKASASKPDEAGRLLVRLKRADRAGAEEGEYDALELGLAKSGLLVLGSLDHPLVGYVSLPKSWKKGGSYPVLIAVDGSGSNFLGCARKFSQTRGSRDVIVLSPVTLSNTNELKPAKYVYYAPEVLTEWNAKRLDFDVPGVDALLAILRTRFGAQEKVFLTGFSGGGNYCYGKLLLAPNEVAGAAPACANYSGQGASGSPGAGDGGGPPVHLMTGELDPHRDHVFGQKPGIEGQTDNVQKQLADLGFTHVERTKVKGAKHSALHSLVWDFVDEVRDGKR